MRSFETSGKPTAHSAAQPFTIRSDAVNPMIQFKMAAIFVLALLTMFAAGFITLNPSSASQAKDLSSLATQGLAATKSDRGTSGHPKEQCQAQAWGAWSEDCAAALTGASKVRNVAFVTVAKSTPTVNETILARYRTIN